MLYCQLQRKNISRAQIHFHSIIRKGELGDKQQEADYRRAGLPSCQGQGDAMYLEVISGGMDVVG